jgi:hypothetical protein
VTTSGDTQVLTRIPVPGSPAGPLPTVALTLAVAAPDATQELASIRPEPAPAESAGQTAVVAGPPAGESHERIYEEAMATIAALASNWSSAVQRTTGRHRAAA